MDDLTPIETLAFRLALEAQDREREMAHLLRSLGPGGGLLEAGLRAGLAQANAAIADVLAAIGEARGEPRPTDGLPYARDRARVGSLEVDFAAGTVTRLEDTPDADEPDPPDPGDPGPDGA